MYLRKFLALACATATAGSIFAQPSALPGVDFGSEPGTLFAPVKLTCDALGIPYKEDHRKVYLNGKADPVPVRTLFTGNKIIAVKDLAPYGVQTIWDPVSLTATLTLNGKSVLVHRGQKFVCVNKRVQQLRAYEGSLLLMETHVSTGRRGHETPAGSFRANWKERMHYSSLYDDAPMPWAVNVVGDVFIHGFTSVPRRPASHGCIRMPLYGRNAASWFWHWVSIGTPVTIANVWVDPSTLPATAAPIPAVAGAHLGAGF